jgi:3-oxoacyl-[acyl-carrier protein] reductase
VFARGRAALSTTRATLTDGYGVDVQLVAGDITNRRAIAALAERVADLGGVDILVLNTPRPPAAMRSFLDETEDDRWDDACRLQLQGSIDVLRAIAPQMVERRWGRIVAITAATVKQPLPNHALSTVFRAGVQAALKHLAAEVGRFGVTVNAVAPAGVVPPDAVVPPAVADRLRSTPLARPGRPEEVAAAVVFLASEPAGYITGQTLPVDGGLTGSLL